MPVRTRREELAESVSARIFMLLYLRENIPVQDAIRRKK